MAHSQYIDKFNTIINAMNLRGIHLIVESILELIISPTLLLKNKIGC